MSDRVQHHINVTSCYTANAKREHNPCTRLIRGGSDADPRQCCIRDCRDSVHHTLNYPLGEMPREAKKETFLFFCRLKLMCGLFLLACLCKWSIPGRGSFSTWCQSFWVITYCKAEFICASPTSTLTHEFGFTDTMPGTAQTVVLHIHVGLAHRATPNVRKEQNTTHCGALYPCFLVCFIDNHTKYRFVLKDTFLSSQTSV